MIPIYEYLFGIIHFNISLACFHWIPHLNVSLAYLTWISKLDISLEYQCAIPMLDHNIGSKYVIPTCYPNIGSQYRMPTCDPNIGSHLNISLEYVTGISHVNDSIAYPTWISHLNISHVQYDINRISVSIALEPPLFGVARWSNIIFLTNCLFIHVIQNTCFQGPCDFCFHAAPACAARWDHMQLLD